MLEFLYSTFPLEFGKRATDGKESGSTTVVQDNDFRLSNSGAFSVKENGKKREFEITFSYLGVSDRFPCYRFIHNIVTVTVVDKICWSLIYFDDANEEAQIYARNIRDVLKKIDVE